MVADAPRHGAAPGQEVVAIAAVGSNGVIGANNDLPFRMPGDLPRVKAMTLGQVLIMGRKSYDSIGKPLPGRTTIVITRDADWWAAGVSVAHSVDEAFRLAAELAPQARVIVFGGGEVYRAAWHRIDRLEITEVDQAPDGDVTFPLIEPSVWVEATRQQRDGFAWVSYLRR